MPLPVFAAQFPPDSHCAIESQFGPGAALAVPVDTVDTPSVAATKAPTRADLKRGLPSLFMSKISPRVSEALPI